MRRTLTLAILGFFLAGPCWAADIKSKETVQAVADYKAAVKAAKLKYGQDLLKAHKAVLAKVSAATDPVSKEALQKEADAILTEITAVKEELKGPSVPAAKPVKGITIPFAAKAGIVTGIGPVKAGEKYQVHINTGPNDKWTPSAANPDCPKKSPLEGGGTYVIEAHVGESAPAKTMTGEQWTVWFRTLAQTITRISSQDQIIEIQADGWLVFCDVERGHGNSDNIGTITGTITKLPKE